MEEKDKAVELAAELAAKERREARIKAKLSQMSREELEKYALNVVNSKASELLSKKETKEIEQTIGEVIKNNLLERIKATKFIDHHLFGHNYNDGSINYNAVNQSFEKFITKALNEDESIKKEFADQVKKSITKHMDNLVENVILRVFMNGIAKSVITTDLFRDAVDERSNRY